MKVTKAKKILGRNLRALRNEKTMSTREIAGGRAGIWLVSRYEQMEAGKVAPKLVTLVRLADALGGEGTFSGTPSVRNKS